MNASSESAETATIFEVSGAIATLTLNERERMNPLTADLQRGCLEAVQRVRDDVSIRALILTARGKGCRIWGELDSVARNRAHPCVGAHAHG